VQEVYEVKRKTVSPCFLSLLGSGEPVRAMKAVRVEQGRNLTARRWLLESVENSH